MRTSRMQPIRFLDQGEMEQLHQGALRILERTGMRVDHDEALEYLRAAGAQVDFKTRAVKFPHVRAVLPGPL